MSDTIRPNDVEEETTVRLEWSPRGGPGNGDSAEGRVTRVWRPDDVQQFTVEADDSLLNVYADYRNPVVERVANPDAEDPDTETVGRLDAITPVDGA
ncbi:MULTISPECIES: hypothetical protein [Halorussus]|uniref:hypothetical protein n=1 Tax=Halorussus TaxID=1070314 RepID=UPI00209FDBDE|nr:hypothetical protein [Halorussus vallis]USZ75930.1 hypothetical protein NGM07_01085 [Halorussus vallis]